MTYRVLQCDKRYIQPLRLEFGNIGRWAGFCLQAYMYPGDGTPPTPPLLSQCTCPPAAGVRF